MSFGRHFGPERHDARQAAVIALLYRREGEWLLPLIVRPPQLLHHAGQVSLPGGLIERGEDARHAALRELHEELGIVPARVYLLGELSPLYVFSSNHRVAPVVGYLAGEPRFQVNALEVARVLEVPIDFLMQKDSLTVMERPEGGSRAKAPAYLWDGEAIWGATCMIVAELMAVLGDALPGRVS
jgi:8-oxo-dGTP pyrophosphatase MutT (NUDIX family)